MKEHLNDPCCVECLKEELLWSSSCGTLGLIIRKLLLLFLIKMRFNLHTIKFIISNGATQWFVVDSQSCATIPTIKFQTISVSPDRHPRPSADTEHSPSLDLPVLDISHEWNHSVVDFCVWPLSLSTAFLRLIHSEAGIRN